MKKTICAGGFLMKGNRFLFGKRSTKKDWAPGLWDIVGGKSLKNEHPLYTLRRETREEIGVSIMNADLLTTIDIKEVDGTFLFTYHIYRITAYKGKPANCSKEHSTIRWFTREELANISLALPEYIQMIDDFLEREHTIDNEDPNSQK